MTIQEKTDRRGERLKMLDVENWVEVVRYKIRERNVLMKAKTLRGMQINEKEKSFVILVFLFHLLKNL